MATALSNFNFRIEAGFTQTVGNDLVSQPMTKTVGGNQVFSSGTGARSVDTMVTNTLAIPASGNVSIDLSDGSYVYSDSTTGQLLNPANQAVAFAKVKAVLAELTVTGKTDPSLNVTVGGGTAALTSAVKFELVSDGTGTPRGGNERTDSAGWPVVNSSTDKIWAFNQQAKIAYLTIVVSGATA